MKHGFRDEAKRVEAAHKEVALRRLAEKAAENGGAAAAPKEAPESTDSDSSD